MLDDVIELGARPLLAVVRFVWWLVWDWFCYEVLWFIGWPLCRLITFGQLPHTAWRDEEEAASLIEMLLVRLVGLLALGGTLWALLQWA